MRCTPDAVQWTGPDTLYRAGDRAGHADHETIERCAYAAKVVKLYAQGIALGTKGDYPANSHDLGGNKRSFIHRCRLFGAICKI